jgi:hypothetical protein
MKMTCGLFYRDEYESTLSSRYIYVLNMKEVPCGSEKLKFGQWSEYV